MLCRGGSFETRTRVASCSDPIGDRLYRSPLPAVCGSSALRLAAGEAQRNRPDVCELLHPIGSLSFACREESGCAPLADCFCGLVESHPRLSDAHPNDSSLEPRRPKEFRGCNYIGSNRMCTAGARASEAFLIYCRRLSLALSHPNLVPHQGFHTRGILATKFKGLPAISLVKKSVSPVNT